MNAFEHAVVRAGEPESQRELWFLHGYGSNEQDLFGLARLIPSKWTVRSLRAPMRLPQGGYAWYDLDFDAKGVRQTNPEQVAEVLVCLIAALQAAPTKPLIFGFSQGGIVSNGLAFSHPELILGCVAVAGYAPMDWFKRLLPWRPDTNLPHLAVVGDEDGVIPTSLSLTSYEAANKLGAGINVQRFAMGHGVAPDSWQAISRWMTAF